MNIPAKKRAPNLVLVGPMGAGKTSVGRRLAERLGLAFADVDREIEAHAGASVATIFECEGEAGFRARETAALAELLAGEEHLVATGGGAVLDPANRRLLRERGFVVYLRIDVPGQLQRLARDRARPLLQREDREDVLRQLAAVREPLYAEIADLGFDTDGMAPADAAAALVQLLAAHWQRPQASRQQA
jgi:shikimate kinase